MQTAEFDLFDGSKKTFSGIYWEAQRIGNDIVDYEKCVYFIEGKIRFLVKVSTKCKGSGLKLGLRSGLGLRRVEKPRC